ncbi:kinetochore protein NUF2 homolog isoform X2 [Trifolium pratense]|uniref:kinetochore protein NUF2 homolog isoform X2 n=1 Tax=Trifolium pratense TaxID=57577 RepID=UPI001E69654C|nr:kinetochore protein NUF2 homolog isoform X2 [Trifolium pratense]
MQQSMQRSRGGKGDAFCLGSGCKSERAASNYQQQTDFFEDYLKKLKEKTVEMDDKISGAEFRLVQNVQENGNLRSKVAQSPDKRALEEKKLAREEARNAERLAMHTLHEKTSLVEVFSKGRFLYFFI